MNSMTTIEAHEHACPTCWQPWEHTDEACPYKSILRCCNACVRKEVFMAMARNMPIPHDHRCFICLLEWGHNDKVCAIAEYYWLECEACMRLIVASSYFCPKCDKKAEKLESAMHAVCYVCRDCQYFFSAQGTDQNKDIPAEIEEDARITMHEYVCPKCGTHFASNKTSAHLCAECGYWLGSHRQDHPKEDGVGEYDAGVG